MTPKSRLFGKKRSNFGPNFSTDFGADYGANFGSDNIISLSYSMATFSANLFGLF